VRASQTAGTGLLAVAHQRGVHDDYGATSNSGPSASGSGRLSAGFAGRAVSRPAGSG
jgi:hypothetical protein